MEWIWHQSTGELYLGGQLFGKGYSGANGAKNVPDMEHVMNLGPIPRGMWRVHAPRDSRRTGKYVLPLEPIDHDAHGRTDFQIHGDSIRNPGEASTGCIVLPRDIRIKIWESGIHILRVVE